MSYIGDFPEDFATVTVTFTTHDPNGAPVAPLSAFEAADVKIYKNGSGVEKTSVNGLTMISPFDSITGLHCLVIDTGNNTGDTGFWETGAHYTVVLSPDTETISNQTVLKVLATFSISIRHPLLDKSVGTIGRGVCTTGGSATSVVSFSFSPAGAVADQFKGRVIIFDGDTLTAALRGQAATITASSNSPTPVFTVVAMTTAPVFGDSFVVV